MMARAEPAYPAEKPKAANERDLSNLNPFISQKRCILTSNTTAHIISEELQVQQKTISARPPAQNLLPATLLLVAVSESDVDMLQREFLFRQLLQTQNDSVLGRILDPRAFRNERSTDL